MKAVPIVSSFPCNTNTQKEVTETRIGAQTQINMNMMWLIRAGHQMSHCTDFTNLMDVHLISHLISCSRASSARSIQRSSQAKNLMNFTYKQVLSERTVNRDRCSYCADKLIQHSHALVSCSRYALVDPLRTLRDEVVQGPADDQDKEASEGRPSEKSGSEMKARSNAITGMKTY